MPRPVVLLTERADLEEPFDGSVELRFSPSLARDQAGLQEALRHVDGLVVRNETQVSSSILGGADRLQVIGRLGVGIDNIDVTFARSRGIEVVYAPDANTSAVAEYCLGQIITVTRLLPWATASTRRGEWNRQAFIGAEMSELTVGVVGYGRVGKRLAELLAALGATVLVSSRRQPAVSPPLLATTLDELIARSDVVTLHVPGTDNTRHLIDERTLRHFKAGAVLLNTSRGSVVSEPALIDALRSGQLAAAVLDVRGVEPPDPGELGSLTNVIATPHIAAFTTAAQRRVNLTVARDILAVLKGDRPNNPAP